MGTVNDHLTYSLLLSSARKIRKSLRAKLHTFFSRKKPDDALIEYIDDSQMVIAQLSKTTTPENVRFIVEQRKKLVALEKNKKTVHSFCIFSIYRCPLKKNHDGQTSAGTFYKAISSIHYTLPI